MLLVVLIASFSNPSRAFAADKLENEARLALKVKSEIAKFGKGSNARVEVKLSNKTKLIGYISEVGNESFVVVDKNGAATTVTYPQVKQVKGNNLSTGVKIAIGIGILFAVALILAPHIAQ